MSPTVLYSFLKNMVGITLVDFIRFYRIQEAKRLLINTNYSISQIAHVCGYQNEITFYRAFKNEQGTTPNEYRISGEVTTNVAPIQGYLAFNKLEVNQILKEYKNLFSSNR